MLAYTLHELQCFDAVVTEGSFHAAAQKLHRSHPAIHSAVKNLESQLGLCLLDRAGYRVALTQEGVAFHKRARLLLLQANAVDDFAAILARGEESDLRLVTGMLCPRNAVVGLLRKFSDLCPQIRLHLHHGAVSGPCERLMDEEVDLIIHPIDKRDTRLEFIDLFEVEMLPVVAPGFLQSPVTDSLTQGEMGQYLQCIIRDSGRRHASLDYFVVDGAPSWTVHDQETKKEVILQGIGWGHLPGYLIERELRDGRLLSIAGKYLKSSRIDVVAARLRGRSHGPAAQKLWRLLEQWAVPLEALQTL